ncbi:MAG: hypothetical protein PUD65_07640 [Spirochaetales bacterium]|nr:hypothetical protein [Spirochaetales bacterium]
MKKVIIILLVLAVSLTGLFAATIQVGPSARFNGDISNVEDYKSISNYEFGAEARVNISAFSLAANVLFGQDRANNIDYFNSIVTANLRGEFAIFELGFGAGFDFPVIWDKSTGDVLVGINGEERPLDKFYEIFTNCDVLFRVSAGVNLGGLGVSADYKLPWSTIQKYFQNQEDSIATMKKGRVSVSLLLNFF